MSTSFNQLEAYIKNSQAFQEALSPLKKSVEIGLCSLEDESLDSSLTRQEGQTVLLNRTAHQPDVIFRLNQEALNKLLQCPDDINQIGVAILKEVGGGRVKISVPGSLFSLLKNGYLDIIKKGGKGFWNHLSEQGITNPTKIVSVIKKMKSKG